MAPTHVVVGRMSLVGQGIELDGAVGVVVAKGDAGGLTASGSGASSGHVAKVSPAAADGADRPE
jgi:hypothetical protein